jgi:hypothetical protein
LTLRDDAVRMSKVDIINPPPPSLRDKVGPRTGGFDAETITRAENALKALSENFQEWISADVERLDAARLAARAAGFDETTTEDLFCRAHDVKGLGATYDYPLATAIAGALCRLIETPEARAASRETPALIEAHVDAIRALVRHQIRDAEDPMGKEVAATLRAHVEAVLGPE